jgi:uncharacterized flavoprotein (TIGR03862 family)
MKKTVAIAGAGPAALMLAGTLDPEKFDVTVYERNTAAGRKFLVAGDGGLNITHSEPIDSFVQRYTPQSFLEKSLRQFSNTDLQQWLKSIGIETYTGSSKRVFPLKEIKPIEVLNAILAVLQKNNVKTLNNHKFTGWDNTALVFENAEGKVHVEADITVFALGGASWKVTGSDGNWTKAFEEKGIRVLPFQPSNCAYNIEWNNEFIEKNEGQSLKNIVLSSAESSRAGEIVITKTGIEGGAVYALSPALRKQLNEKGKAKLLIDLKPSITVQQIKDKFMNRGNRSIKKLLEDRLSFSNVQVDLLKSVLSKDDFTDLEKLAEKIKALPLLITGMAPLDEAISTVGGIALREVDENFQLIKMPGTYVIGEMLNWDAPTGGYLLQASFSMGRWVGEKLNGSKK